MNKEKLRHDILIELFNVAVGKASSLLSEITNKKILLHVPDVEMLDFSGDKPTGVDRLRTLDGTLMVSSITFQNGLSGKANLIFPADKVRTLIDLCLNIQDQENNGDLEFTDIDLDIVKEIGNIVLNSIIGEFGNSLNIPFSYSLPEVKLFDKDEFGSKDRKSKYVYWLILSVSFNINGTEIVGAIRIELSINSMTDLLKRIDQIGDQVNE